MYIASYLDINDNMKTTFNYKMLKIYLALLLEVEEMDNVNILQHWKIFSWRFFHSSYPKVQNFIISYTHQTIPT